jgi:hypothetical protein
VKKGKLNEEKIKRIFIQWSPMKIAVTREIFIRMFLRIE